MKLLEMFAGTGGFRLGLEQAGFSFDWVGFCEIDKYASECYKKHWPKSEELGDATRIISNRLSDIDLLVGGFPCQAFSIAGKRKGFKDLRGTLFFEIARIAKDKRPKIIFLENVKGLLSHDEGRTFKFIIRTLDELGYILQWQMLNSKNFGVPQNRERVFIVGYLGRECFRKVFPIKKNSQADIGIPTLTARYYQAQANGCYLREITKGASEVGGIDIKTGLYAVPLKFLDRNQKNYQGEYSFAIDTVNTGGIMRNNRIRRLTPLECERLQGFPDGWTKGFSDTQRYKMLGNAVTVNVIKAIGEKL